MTGVIYATGMEAAPFLTRAGIREDTIPRDPSTPQFFDLRPTHAIVLCICGMGPENARRAAVSLLQAHALSRIINPGVAGALSDQASVGDIYRISSAFLWPDASAPLTGSDDGWIDRPARRLVTVQEPVFDPARRTELARLADLVDMEGAAIAQVCAAQQVPLYMIKGITDQAGSQDRKRLLQNLGPVSERVAEIVWGKLTGL